MLNGIKTWPSRAAAILARYIGAEGMLMLVALLVGLSAGIGGVGFRWLIKAIHHISFDWLPAATADWGLAYIVIAPVVGGALVGPLIWFFAREAKGHGVPEVMAAVALRGGRIRPIVAIVKSLASALSIGTGGSVGREGPIVQIGSTIGSTLGQVLKLSDERVRNLVACGAAAGIAATFNTPIAGVIFALEIILGDFSVRSFGTVVIASVTSSVVGRAAFGDIPAFATPEYALNSMWEFPMYAVLGVLGAVVGAIYTRTIYASEDLFDGWTAVPEWVKPAIGGALLGLFALAYGLVPGLGYGTVPQVYGVGYQTIEGGLHGELILFVMLALVVLKIASTAITLGSGGSGGVFAPSLFIGSMLGGAFGLTMEMLFPGIPGPPGAYALVGMGAVFAGSTHAAMTAMLMMFEMTGDYKIILPLMLTVVASTVISRKLLRGENIYTMKLSRRGVRLRRGRDVDVLEGVRAEEVMSNAAVVRPDTPIVGVTQLFIKANRNAFPVVDDDEKLVGIISLTDVRNAEEREEESDDPSTALNQLSVKDLMATNLITAFPDETLNELLKRMAPRDLSRLPVVARDDEQQLLGVVRRSDLLRAYNLALTQSGSESLEIPTNLRRVGPVEFVEVNVTTATPCVGLTVAEFSQRLPAESLLISIRRADGEVVFPHGDTRFQPGDRIIAYARMAKIEALRKSFE